MKHNTKKIKKLLLNEFRVTTSIHESLEDCCSMCRENNLKQTTAITFNAIITQLNSNCTAVVDFIVDTSISVAETFSLN